MTGGGRPKSTEVDGLYQAQPAQIEPHTGEQL
jgi:hypothetical protein